MKKYRKGIIAFLAITMLILTSFVSATTSKPSESDNPYEFEIIIELNTSYGNYMDQWFNYLDDEYWYSIGSDAHHKDSLGNTTLAVNFLKERNKTKPKPAKAK